MASVSIVVPIYNSEGTLKRCIESICKQSFEDIEIILVNDGSTDSSAEICSAILAKDKRIKLLNQDNSGADKARQNGIQLCTSAYIAFVDSDDYIDSEMIRNLYNEATTHNADIVQCNYWAVSVQNKTRKVGSRSCFIGNVLGNENCIKAYVEQKYVTNFLWDKLFKRSLFENITHMAYSTGEDVCLLVQLFGSSERIRLLSEPYYNYVLTNNSLTRAKFNLGQLDSVYAGVYVFNYCQGKYPELCDYARLMICSYAARYFCKLRSTRLSNDKQEEMREIFLKYYKAMNPANYAASLKRRVLIELFRLSPCLCCSVLNLLD